MNQPHIADNKPKRVTLEIGKSYYFCTCGKSDNQPFCNGSHKGGSFAPVAFTADKEEAGLCMCKHSSNFPYCDGTHKTLTT